MLKKSMYILLSLFVILFSFNCNKNETANTNNQTTQSQAQGNASNQTANTNQNQMQTQGQTLPAVSVNISVYRQTAQGAQVRVNPNYPFRSGDKIRLGISSSQKGYLYLILQGTSGSPVLLYPHKKIAGGLNTINAGQEMIIPSEGWFSFDNKPGTEKLYAYYSNRPDQIFFKNIERATRYRGSKSDSNIEMQVLKKLQNRAISIQKNLSYTPSSNQTVQPMVFTGNSAVVAMLELSHE